VSTSVFISGSRSIKALPFDALESIEAIIAQGFTVLVGDCFGVDTLVQDYLFDRNYQNVIVCHIGTRPRNNRGFKTHHVAGTRQTDKDAYMGQTANFGLAIWDGVSPGTAKNVARVKTKVITVAAPNPRIRFTTGNMFNTQAEILINTVNCVGVMGAGIALQFKQRYPRMFDEYRRKCAAGEIRPGELHVWQSLNGERIINFPTKRHWRNDSRYEHIEAGLLALRRFLASQGPVRVTIPALGCGNGGLNWSVVSAMISKHLQGLDCDIMVFEPSRSRPSPINDPMHWHRSPRA
jgi:O-acetyl-ADP-ribose deacetylase (regulator of RNase III)